MTQSPPPVNLGVASFLGFLKNLSAACGIGHKRHASTVLGYFGELCAGSKCSRALCTRHCLTVAPLKEHQFHFYDTSMTYPDLYFIRASGGLAFEPDFFRHLTHPHNRIGDQFW